jgi:hypothetical protein
MRWLPSLVGIESLVLCLLLALWWSADLGIVPRSPESGSRPLGSDAAEAQSAGIGTIATPAAADSTTERTAAQAATASVERGVILHGRLLAPNPLADVEQIQLGLRRSDAWRGADVHPSGRYAIADLTAGTWQVHCEVPGFRRQRFEHTLTEAPFQVLDIPLQAATVLPVFLRTHEDTRLQVELAKLGFWQGLVVVATRDPLVGDLEPTEHASVHLVGVGNHRQDSDLNRRQDPNAGDGVLELDQAPPVHAALLLRHMVLAQQRIDPGQTELRFVVDPTAIKARMAVARLRLLGPDGPLANATVRLSTSQGGGSAGKSDEQGLVRIENVLPGITSVDITAKACESIHTHWTLAPGVERDLGDVVLTPAVELQGKVVDASGKPVRALVQWTALDLWQPPHPRSDRRNAVADGDGNFTIQAGRRRYSVRARSDDQQVGFAIVDGARAGTERWVVTVQKGHALRLHNASQQVRVGVVTDPSGNLLEVLRLELRWPEAAATLPDGDYRLHVYDGHGRPLGQETLRMAGAEVPKELR